METTRREFSRESLLLVFGGLTITVSGCGGGGGGGGAGGGAGIDPLYGGPSSLPASPGPTRQGRVSDNHGHSAIVTEVEFESSSTVTLDIQGAADHPHRLTLSVEELASIAAGEPLSKQTSTDPSSVGTHAHTVSFDPAPPIAV